MSCTSIARANASTSFASSEASEGVKSPTATASAMAAAAATASLAFVSFGRVNVTGLSFRTGEMRSMQRRSAAISPVFASSIARERLRTLSTANAEAYFFVSDALLVIGHAASIVDAANALRMPTMMLDIGIVRAGALAGYGPDLREYGRRPASYVARILARTLPRDLPVETVHQQALAINLKTANAIGLDIPPLLLTRADEVIE
jgi:ABC transporter substrate binding protein